jgi:hypothetical protein
MKETLAFLGGGIATLIVLFALVLLAIHYGLRIG